MALTVPPAGNPLLPAGINRILVIKLRAVGDVLLSTIVLRSLRAYFPEAQIDFCTEPPARDIVARNPDLSRVILYDRRKAGALHYIQAVRRGGYDLVFDLFGNPRSALLTRLSGAPVRVGYDFRGRRYAYTHVVAPRGDRVHNTQFNLDALEALGIPIVDRTIPFYYAPEDERYVAEILGEFFPDGRPFVGLNIGAGGYTRRWPLERYAELADRLVEKFGVGILLPWGPGQLPEVEEVKGLMAQEGVIPPPTTLPQLGVLLKKCAFVVTNDTGPMHIAAVVGTPVLAIYGPTNPLLQGPYGEGHLVVRREGLDCLGCNLTSCPIGHPCMKELSVETVLEGAERLILRNRIPLRSGRR